MTLIVGIRCTDGVVMGTDSAATFGPSSQQPTITQAVRKMTVIDDRIIIAGSGPVGLCQRFEAAVDRCKGQFPRNSKKKSAVQVGTLIAAKAIEDFNTTVKRHPVVGYEYAALLAVSCKDGPSLIEFDPHSQPEVKELDKLWYASIGSGQRIADPLLGFIRRVFWTESGAPTLQDGMFAALLVLKLGCEMGASLGVTEPVRMNILGENGVVREVEAEVLDEHMQNVERALEHFGTYGIVSAEEPVDELPIPTPT